MATGMEHFGALGFRAHGESEFPITKLHPILSTFECTHLKKLAGNGMHLQTQMALMVFILAFVVSAQQQHLECTLEKGREFD